MKIKIIKWHPVVIKFMDDITPLIKVKEVKPKRYTRLRLYKVRPINIRAVVI